MKYDELMPLNEEHVLVFAFRYALGRRSAAPSIVATQLALEWSWMRDATKQQILREIDEAIESGQAGDQCDLETWSKVRDFK